MIIINKQPLTLFFSAFLLVSWISISDETALDTDADGMPDLWETQYGLNPQNPNDAYSDQDSDGKNALAEYTQGQLPVGQWISMVMKYLRNWVF
jgi:hypothetical protein